MFYSDLKPNFKKNILTTVSHSLIIDLSNDMGFLHVLSPFNKNI